MMMILAVRSFGLQGEWNLINVTGGFTEVDQDFEEGIIIWDFNESDSMLTITNNSTITEVYDGFPSGVYSYSVVTLANGSEELVVNEINLGTFTSTSDSFTVNQQFRDGFRIQFMR
ncbi:hypothetical protein [Aquimarina sp. LLG6339-5]|uniref:hypothetical protein n=1 Tax=Aquimarina sp. LLG6339-5 TaxID=3160830 RepID=UPI003867356D